MLRFGKEESDNDASFMPVNCGLTKFDFYGCHLSGVLAFNIQRGDTHKILDYVRCNHSEHKTELLLSNSMLMEEIVNIGVVDVDFAANLGEGDEALVAVVLPCFG